MMIKIINYFHYSLCRLNLNFHTQLYYFIRSVGRIILKNDEAKIEEHKRGYMKSIDDIDFIVSNRFTMVTFIGTLCLLTINFFAYTLYVLKIEMRPIWIYVILSVAFSVAFSYLLSYRKKLYKGYFRQIDKQSEQYKIMIHLASTTLFIFILASFVYACLNIM